VSPGSRPGPRRLRREFFARPTLEVAQDLIGRRLVRVRRGRRLSGRIVEVEAYVGETDTACHGRSGPTPRNRVLFGAPGLAYVYFTYGMHHLLNLVTETEGFPSAVLLRALEPEEGVERMTRLREVHAGRSGSRAAPARRRANWLAGGPARLCRALDVDLHLNGHDVVEEERLFLEEGEPPGRRRIARTSRIGIEYAETRDRLAPWRYAFLCSPCLSRPLAGG
jgi:DNA-3-methyladenine glycosylase